MPLGDIISIVNRKGGVGKTTLAIALAETFVFEYKFNVLIVDLDPQSSASEALLTEGKYRAQVENKKTIADYLRQNGTKNSPSLDQVIVGGRHSLRGRQSCNLAIAVNSPDLWDVEWHQIRNQQEEGFRQTIAEMLHEWRNQFDIVLIDCPPGRTISTDVALLSSSVVLCPVIPQQLAVWGMEKMRNQFLTLTSQGKHPAWRFVITHATQNNVEDEQIAIIRTKFGGLLMQDVVTRRGIDSKEYLEIPRRQKFPDRLALLRKHPEKIKTLEGFYGAELTMKLRRIAEAALKDVPHG
jgi:cellulose biosynthesis protein BcsQ